MESIITKFLKAEVYEMDHENMNENTKKADLGVLLTKYLTWNLSHEFLIVEILI